MTAATPPAPSVHEPPILCRELPGTGGDIGPEPEHFRVDEIPAYEPSGAGEHLYVRLQKRGVTTPDAVRRVAQAADVSDRDIGYAGLKDKHAITTQWLSLPGRCRPVEQWELPEGLEVLEVSRHVNKLRTGHLRGNRFSISLLGVEPAAVDNAQRIAQHLQTHGVLNYFGAQRFGRNGDNLPRALDWLASGAKQRLSAFLVKLLPSVLQSELFNRYLTRRSELGLSELFAGEVVRLEGSSAHFIVEDVEAERPRFERREFHLTGPMLGPKMRPAAGRARELELEIVREMSLSDETLDTLGRFAPGARRDLIIPLPQIDINSSVPQQLTLSFALPAGSYATIVLREFTRSGWLSGRQPLED